MAEHRQRLLARYDDFIALYGGDKSINGKTLENYRTEIPYSESVQNAMKQELESSGYVQRAFTAAKIAELEGERLRNEAAIAALKDAGSDANDLETLAQLIVRNKEIDYQIAILSDETNLTAFEAQLLIQAEKLDYAAVTLKKVSDEIYRLQTETAFLSLEKTGGTNSFAGGAIAFALSFLLMSAIVWAIRPNRGATYKEPPVATPDEKLITDGDGAVINSDKI